jgi:hypothetical protein
MTPKFGLTQYRFGAVALILKQIFRSVGLRRVNSEETQELKGPTKVSWLAGSTIKAFASGKEDKADALMGRSVFARVHSLLPSNVPESRLAPPSSRMKTLGLGLIFN